MTPVWVPVRWAQACCRKKIQDAGLSQISVTNSAINNLPPDVDLVITHRDLTERAMRQVPQAQHISLTNFLDSGLYTSLTERLVAAQRILKTK
ncbi:PTS system subunit IIABC [Escherichia coli]|uniref:PTS system subunit IIABC n=1 Tax=Escherichia coli TaxID=562 RepID=A0A377AJ77_ECOLX|nr:PTS system subunit IIABC [Escherichia coli]